MKFGSLFTGIGGFDLGLEQAGMECAWQCELDQHASRVLAAHWPHVRRETDVRTIGTDLEPVDLICGGFPCQDLSVAGKRAGLKGERSGLWWEFHRILGALLPQYVLIENVPGLLSSHKGRDMGLLLGSLAELGYGWAYRVLDAQYFGVPQRRRRVFIVASLGGQWQRAAEILFEPESGSRNPAPRRETGERITGSLTARAGKNGAGANDEVDAGRLIAFNNRQDPVVSGDILQPLGARDNGMAIAFQQNTRDEVRQINGDGQIAGALAAQAGMKQQNYIAFGGNNTQGEIAVSTAINAHPSGRYDFESETFVGYETGQGYWQSGDHAGTLRAEGENRPSRPSNIVNGVRRLTPLECERLQGFPEGWTAGQSDTQRYRQLGNAVAVPVIRWIGNRIIPHETTPE